MDESQMVQNRRQRRAQVFMAAALELSGGSLPVKMRNLSADGALVEGDKLPVEGTEVVFRRQELNVAARVIWVRNRRAGLAFKEQLPPEAVLRHVPTPRPRVMPSFRRPGFTERTSEAQQQLADDWGWRPGFDRAGE
jgi:hypothetical protein